MTRILLAHPLPTVRRRQALHLAAEPGFTIAHEVRDLTETYHAAEHDRPDLALVDAALAAAPEFEVLVLLFRALGIGYLVLADETGLDRAPDLPGTARPVALSEVPGLARRVCAAARTAAPAAFRETVPATPAAATAAAVPAPPDRIVLLGASTGGVEALIRVLSTFPADAPPVLIVQHTGGAFTPGLARLLDGAARPSVREAVDGAPLRRGEVMLAPGDARHLEIRPGPEPRAVLREGPPVSGHRPSIDALFTSAVPLGQRISAALLTGMGRDGAEGLLALRRSGAQTLAQDEATSVVFGMPRVARDIGAVERQLPLDRIGPALLAPSGVSIATTRSATR